MNTPTQSPRSHFWLIVALGFMNALTPFTIDLYLPAFGDIAKDLSSTVPLVSLSVATYFIGFAMGQIIYGPLLDRFGRKPPIYVGLSLYILATLGCMTAQSVEALMIFRFLSALGGSAASVAAVTMVRDFFEPEESAKVFSMLMLVLSVSPLFAPSIGGWIAAEFNWRIIFAVLAVMALIDVVIARFGLPTVYKADRSVILKPGPIFQNFKEVFNNRQFRTYAVAGAFSFAGLFVYLTGSPAIYIDGFGVSKQTFGIIFGALATGMIGGGQINNFLIKKFKSPEIYKVAIACQIILSLVFLIILLFFKIPLLPTTILFFLLLTTIGIGYPNAAALALQPITKNVGSASSLLGFLQMSLGAVLAALVGMMKMSGTLPTVVVMVFSSLLAGYVLWSGSVKLKTD